jgi:hypothetical protein
MGVLGEKIANKTIRDICHRRIWRETPNDSERGVNRTRQHYRRLR